MEEPTPQRPGTVPARRARCPPAGGQRSRGRPTPRLEYGRCRPCPRPPPGPLGNPLLVRAGRSMVLARAEAMRPRVRDVVAQARQLLAPEREFSPATLERTFTVNATDHVLIVLGPSIDGLAREEAPAAGLRFLPNTVEDATALREGAIDWLSGGDLRRATPGGPNRTSCSPIGSCAWLAGTIRTSATASPSPATSRSSAVQVAPRGRPGGYVDRLRAERGWTPPESRAQCPTSSPRSSWSRKPTTCSRSGGVLPRAWLPAWGCARSNPP